MARKFDLGKNKDKAEYLVLGIGQSPADLKKAFNIAYLGNDGIDGIKCSVLEFKPKDGKAAALFSSITVWINENTGISVRMKMEEPFGDYIIVDFADEKLNDSKFEQTLPAGVDILRIN
jgi:outer membrane lipoprotein-sorting protein